MSDFPTRSESPSARAYALVLGILAFAFAFAFALRVSGQIVAALFGPAFLPPMEECYSGVLPYPYLVISQLVILVFQFEVSRQLRAGAGPLARERPRLGVGLKWFSLVYFLAMVARYAITMGTHPERRWFGGTIPIFFHQVLAAYVYLLSRYHRGLPLGRQR